MTKPTQAQPTLATQPSVRPSEIPSEIEEIREVEDDDVSIDVEVPPAHDFDLSDDDHDGQDYPAPTLMELLAVGVESSEGVGLADIAAHAADSLARIADGIDRHNKLLFKIARHLESARGGSATPRTGA